ncbi:MAG: neutral/alkaline non-lysosomal ceramidase N-terminal domain-containing protein [Pseudomonadota bacterium]
MYQAGWSRQEIGITPQGYAMHGYGHWQHRARGVRTPLYARALYLADADGGALYFCCLDLGYVTHAMREGVCAELGRRLGAGFDEAALVLTCTHTHSGPGGCAHEALYNVVTPGFVPAHVDAIVAAATQSLLAARSSAAATTLVLADGAFDPAVPVAWNRSLAAYNRNPDVQRRRAADTHLALDRSMAVLGLMRDGRPAALLSLFGVHATCLGNSLSLHDGDNKGRAARHAEALLEAAGASGAVAIFAQATAGDVSPHYQGPGDIARRAALRGEAEYEYAERNGRYQGELALALLQGAGNAISGPLDAIFSYADFSAVHADPAFTGGEADAWTSPPAHGVAFFAGTRVDGPGMPSPLATGARFLSRRLRQRRLRQLAHYPAGEQAYFRRLYAAQGPKDIVLESAPKTVLGIALARLPLPDIADPLVAELKRQARRGALRDSPLVPTVLPLQVVTLGSLALLCCPGEFTTTAGRRLRESVAAVLAARGVTRTLLCSYCNDYMGYVTTFEEYQEQAYEGGHTVYGQWTLAAFQTRFDALARELCRPAPERRHDRLTRPAPVPPAELALRSQLPPP